MPKHTLTGNIKRHRAFRSRILGNRRDVLVYLPRGYWRFSRRRYPVLYLQDGQNVFDAATSFAGVEWGVDETAERLIQKKLIDPPIIVAIANMGDDRIHEYAPTRSLIDAKAKRKKRSKGLARNYGRFLIEEMVEDLDEKLPLRIWLDTGTAEEGWERARILRDALVEKGWRLYNDLNYKEIKGGDHSEGAW